MNEDTAPLMGYGEVPDPRAYEDELVEAVRRVLGAGLALAAVGGDVGETLGIAGIEQGAIESGGTSGAGLQL